MATRHLGQPFDLHLASSDLIFPHGDNEIAVAEGLTGLPLAKMWLHSEVVMAEGKKISRTHGNDLTLADLLAQGHEPATVRYWLLSQHYRRVLTCSPEQLTAAAKNVQRLNEFVRRLVFLAPCQSAPEVDQLIYEAKSGYQESMDNDLNLPQAMGHIFAFIKKINGLLGKGLMDQHQVELVLEFMARVDAVLGVVDFSRAPADPEIDLLMANRAQARQEGKYDLADQIRDKLLALKVELIDTPTGTRWRRA